MNILKLLSTATLTVMSMSLGAMGNFDLVNSYPKIPVYYKINNTPGWQVLRNNHISARVPVDGQINLTLSATPDGANPTHFIFSPQRFRNLGLITCYIQVHVKQGKRDGQVIKTVDIAPQNQGPVRLKTRHGFSLANNITYPLIGQFKLQAEAAQPVRAVPAAAAAAAEPMPAPAPRQVVAQAPVRQQAAVLPVIAQEPLVKATAEKQMPTPAPRTIVAHEAIALQQAQTATLAQQQAAVLPVAAVAAAAVAQEVVAADPVFNQEQAAIVAQLRIRPEQAQTIFNFFDMLNGMLVQAEQNRDAGVLRNLYISLGQPTPDQFKDCVRLILGLGKEAVLPQENTINALWESILSTRPVLDRTNRVIYSSITLKIVRQPQYLADAQTLVAILEKWQAGLPEGGIRTVWAELAPEHKLYYMMLLRFRCAVSEAQARMHAQGEAAPAAK